MFKGLVTEKLGLHYSTAQLKGEVLKTQFSTNQLFGTTHKTLIASKIHNSFLITSYLYFINRESCRQGRSNIFLNLGFVCKSCP